MGRAGERIAAAFLVSRGAQIVGRNVTVGGGEIDLLVRFGSAYVAVEVKTIGPGAIATDPGDRLSETKLRQVRSLAARIDAAVVARIDFVGVRLTASGAVVTWRTGVA